MKKRMYLGAVLSCLMLGSVSAKTWTSADGSKTFKGEFKDFDTETNEVTVNVRGVNKKFPLSMLNDADQTWVKAELTKQKLADLDSVLNEQKIGKLFTQTNLSKLDTDAFKKANFEKIPEYYLLYFTASW